MAKTEDYDEQHRKILGHLLASRRGELGYDTRPAMARATGLNERLQADVENGYRANFKDDTLGRIAAAYQTTARGILAVLRGDADQLEPAAPPAAQPPPVEPLPGMNGDEEAAYRPYADAIWEHIASHGGDGPGDRLFGPGTREANLWDDLAGLRFTLKQRVWTLAIARYSADPRNRRSAPPAG